MTKIVERAIWLDDGKKIKNENEHVWYSDLVIMYNDNSNELFRVDLFNYPYLNIINTRYKRFFNVKQLKGMTQVEAKKTIINISKEWFDFQSEEAFYRKALDDRQRLNMIEFIEKRKRIEKAVNEALKRIYEEEV